MCGRLNVIDNPVMKIVFDILGIDFYTKTNHDLRPTQEVAVVAAVDGMMQPLHTTWGIKPGWSKKLIINAQSETVAEKKTFKKAFQQHRCLVPCSGWYEWRDEGGKRKQKYLFEPANDSPLFMAGIWYSGENSHELVTLTVKPNEQCAEYHHRMPLLIAPEELTYWLNSTVEEVQALLTAPADDILKITKA
jgi:putative SOS response-associated peptidase YedK